MNYQNIYNQLIAKRQDILFEGYTEKHHIIPKCMGGTDLPENLVRLTAREHFIAHVILAKIYKTVQSIVYSANMMSNFKRYNSKEYSWLKIISISIRRGKPRSEETKRRISEACKGIPCSDERKQKLKDYFKNNPDKKMESIKKGAKKRIGKPSGMLGKTCTDEHKQKISDSNSGKVRTEDAKQKYAESKLGNKNPMFGKKWSDEQREKIKLAKEKSKQNYIGE